MVVVAEGPGRKSGLAGFRGVSLAVPPQEDHAGPNRRKYNQADEVGDRTPSTPGSVTGSGRRAGGRLAVDRRLPGTFPGRSPGSSVTRRSLGPGHPIRLLTRYVIVVVTRPGLATVTQGASRRQQRCRDQEGRQET